jgi:CubicO group peptidase (beta-lactamase class C family)/lysophospholipase L1-like esterase
MNSSSLGSPRALLMQINNSGLSMMSDAGSVTIGVWQHVAVTFQDGILQFFVDGVARGVSTSVPLPLARVAPIRIGGRATDDQRGFDGAIDEVRIWDRALSQQEIQDNMGIELTGSEPGMLAYLPMNEGQGQTVVDLTANGNNGSLGSTSGADPADPEWFSTSPPPNTAPTVNAGDDQAIALPDNTVQLTGVVSDDGQPLGTLNLAWSMAIGPGAVSFVDPTLANTTATFTVPGDYVLELTASDSSLVSTDQMSVTVFPSAVLSTVQVSPDPAVVLTGGTQQFQASGLDQVGKPYAIEPTWGASGGSIDQGGLFSSGITAGQFVVTASAEGVLGQADVILVDELGPYPGSAWITALPADMEMDQSLLEQARDYALTTGGAGMITRHGRQVFSWGDTTATYDVKSVTKSIGSMMLGLAVKDNLVDLADLAQSHYPAIGANPATNVDTGWLGQITIRDLVTHTAGFDKPSDYTDILYQPGTTWAYSDGGVNWLADTLTVVNQGDLFPILRSRILDPLGVPPEQLDWTESRHRDLLVEGFPRREFNSSIFLSADAMTRLGYLALRNGVWNEEVIIPPAFVDQMRKTVPGVIGLPVSNDLDSKYNAAPNHYGISWWNNADGSLPNVPNDAFWAWGLGDHLILVIPSLDIVAARTGSSWSGSRTPSYYAVLAPFFDPIVQSVVAFGNQAPNVNAGTDATISLPTNSIGLNGTVSDDGLPDGTLDISWSLFNGPAGVTFGDDTLAETSATFTAAGDYILRLAATDGLSTASDDVLVSVLPEPDTQLPQVFITDPAAGSTISGFVVVSATATDNDRVDEVEFFAAGSSIGVDTTAPYSAVWNSVAETDADYDITAVARDPSGNEGGDSIIVTLDNAGAVNAPPSVDAGTDAEIILPTNSVGLSGTASDDGLPTGTLNTTWTAVNPPNSVIFDDATALVTNASFGGPGSYVLRLTADDGLLSSSADVVITVTPESTGEQTFVTVGDSFINGNAANTNYGSRGDVVVHGYGPKVGLVQFDLSPLNGSAISNAVFNFRLNSLRTGGNIDLQLIDEPWSESSVNFANQPAFSGTVQSVPVTTADVGSMVSVDLTEIVQNWVNGSQPNHGLRLETSQTIKAEINSSESPGTPMQLVVTLAQSQATVPGVIGQSQAVAEAAIVGANLTVGAITTQNDAAVPAGVVISQDPLGGTVVAAGSEVNLVVSLGPAIEPPNVTLLSPEDGATLTGWLTLSANATDNLGVTSVSFAVDGTEIATLAAPPYEFDWDSNTLTSGAHELVVTATDSSNNQTSVSATIYVDSLSAQPSAYPMSTTITGLQWAPSATISRAALGSDNWPITWADDGDLYTAYGDGQGFDPPLQERLSLGYARIAGPATAFTGENIRSPSGEHYGTGPAGKKSSGLLMVGGVLYQWVRNANNNGEQCELAWSADYGDTWVWSNWQFAEFGYCAFLNFGQDYAGARDSYVYMYSPDTPSAYNETDNLILTRVLKDQITDRNAYEFFRGLDAFDNPIWTTDISERQPVFTFDGAANRLDVTYHPILGRYLMTLRSRAMNGGRNQFSIFEAKEPWGAWSVVYFTESWEGAAISSEYGEWGEAQHIPSKWMSADSREFYLVFSGDDAFSVRRATLTVVPDTTLPAVNLISPGNGEAVAGTVLVSASASDDYAIRSVAFDVDGTFIGELFGPPFSLDWDTESVATGEHVLTALATDTSNNQSTSSVTVSVLRDTQSPSVAISSPASGSTVIGATPVSAIASDDVAVASVRFAVGATVLGTTTAAPYQVNWDTTAYTNGPYQVTATATDTSGNSADATVTVTVDNGLPLNEPPAVNAGADDNITLPTDTISLSGAANDDGLPNGSLTTNWTAINPPFPVIFLDATALATDATFGGPGTYVLRLTADDGVLSASADVTVTVNPESVVTNQTLTAVEDSFVNGNAADGNFGSNVDIVIHSYGPKIGLVQFDLSSLSGATVSSAVFNFRLNNLRAGGNINLQLIDEAWSESSVTFASQPAFGATFLSVPVTTADVGSVLSVDVTQAVQNWISGVQPNHGIRMQTSQSIKAEIDTSESAGIPMYLELAIDTGLPTVATPTISPGGATSTIPVEVTLATTTPGAEIYFTLDGSTPTTASNLYSVPFILPASATVKARAFAAGYQDSAVSSADFTITGTNGGSLNNYWPLNELVSGNYANNSGSAAGSCASCPTSVGGRVDNGQSFNGTSDMIMIADDDSLDWPVGGEFSIEFWINTSNACTDRQVVVGRYDSGATMQWSVGCDTGMPYFELADTSGNSVLLTGTTSINDGEWHHLTAVHDAFYGENRLYVDGALDASAVAQYTAGFESPAGMTIGVLQNGAGDTFFDGVIDEVAVHGRAVPDALIRRHYQDGTIGLRKGYLGCDATVDLMPLGDSNTNRLGYRPTLYFELTDRGYDINFVGSRSDSISSGSHDRDHEGWSGFTTTDIASNLNGWLLANPPDVVLLHIGTNDLSAVSVSEAITGLGSVLDTAYAVDPDITIVLAQIVNRQTFSQDTADFNDQMVGLVQSRLAAGFKILLVDHESALLYPDDMSDLLHPNDTGYAKMADVWFEGISGFVPVCSSVAPSFASTPLPTGQVGTEYRYRPVVLSEPAGRFTLLTAPSGMQIHPDTGEIRWTPATSGQYQVDIQVQNPVGSAVQNLLLNVP